MLGGNFANHNGMDFGFDPGWAPGVMMPLGAAGWGMYNPDINNLQQQPNAWDQMNEEVDEYLGEDEEEDDDEGQEEAEVAFASHVSRLFAK